MMSIRPFPAVGPRSLPVLSFALLTWLTLTGPAHAQSAAPAALPTAPGADRAMQGGPTAARASLPGGPGLSPLEPYLITWLLPASGLLTVAAGMYVDRRMRTRYPRRLR